MLTIDIALKMKVDFVNVFGQVILYDFIITNPKCFSVNLMLQQWCDLLLEQWWPKVDDEVLNIFHFVINIVIIQMLLQFLLMDIIFNNSLPISDWDVLIIITTHIWHIIHKLGKIWIIQQLSKIVDWFIIVVLTKEVFVCIQADIICHHCFFRGIQTFRQFIPQNHVMKNDLKYLAYLVALILLLEYFLNQQRAIVLNLVEDWRIFMHI